MTRTVIGCFKASNKPVRLTVRPIKKKIHMVAKFEINWPSTHSLPSKNSGCISPKKDDTTRQNTKPIPLGNSLFLAIIIVISK
jgi:hypothetical protein